MAQVFRFYTYRLNDGQGATTLDLSIGNGQAASSMIQLDGRTLQSGLSDSFSFDVGSVQAGQQLDFSTTVADVNPENNDVSFRFKLSGGETTLHPPTDRLRAAQNGFVNFFITIIFL